MQRPVAGRDLDLLDLLGDLVLDEHAVEPALGLRGRVLAPEAPHERAREGALRVARAQALGDRAAEQQPVPGVQELVRDPQRLAVHVLRRIGDPDLVAVGLRHLALAVGPVEQRHGQHHLRRLAVGGLQRPAHEEVEGLVGAAELDVGADRDRVVALEHRVQQLEQRDRLGGRHPLGEVVALEQLGDRDEADEPEQVLHRHVQPLRVAADLQPLVVGEHLGRLVEVGLGVLVDLRRREHRPGRRAPRRITDPRRVVADDQHDGVPEVLELAQLLQDHRVAEVEVLRGGVQTELDPERSALRQTLLEQPVRAHIYRVAGEELRG